MTSEVNSVVQLVASLQIRNSNNAEVLLDSGLNLFDIMANLCSKLYCEVLLKSRNYVVYLLKCTSALDFKKRGCVRHLSRLKLSVSIANPCSKLLCTIVRETFRNQTLVFRT